MLDTPMKILMLKRERNNIEKEIKDCGFIIMSWYVQLIEIDKKIKSLQYQNLWQYTITYKIPTNEDLANDFKLL